MTLLEENAKKLAEMEEEWASLGRIRQVDFHCTFSDGNKDERATAAHVFVSRAQDAGFQIARSEDEHGFSYSVTASMRVEPTAETITELQITLQSFIHFLEDPPENEDPSYFLNASGVRWSYPPKEVVTFWPNDKNAHAVNSRFRAMSGDALLQDPLQKGGGSHTGLRPIHDAQTSFTLVPSEFLRRAQSLRPNAPEPTVSAFSQWVYSLYSRAFGDDEDRVSGTEAEKEIWERRKRSATHSIDSAYLRRAKSEWRLIYNGLRLREHDHADYFTIPHLKVNNEGLRASPDLMYAGPGGSELVIVEIKFSQQPIPKNLWPNIWAQLWCYAQLETSLHARKVTVIGEIWGRAWPYGYTPPGGQVICLRALVRRDPRVEAYDRFFRQLFQVYAGVRNQA